MLTLIQAGNKIINVNTGVYFVKVLDKIEIFTGNGAFTTITGQEANWLWQKLQNMCLFSSEEMEENYTKKGYEDLLK